MPEPGKQAKARLSVVIPVYNSEKTIGPLTEELIRAFSDLWDLEIVLVNDRSRDGSERICISLYEKYPAAVKFYSLARNVGEHNAVMAGLNKSEGDYVLIMDDDFQNPVSEALKLVQAAARDGYDAVYACYDRKQHSLFRNFGSWLNDKMANFFLKKPRDLYLSSFKVMNRFLVDEIVRYQTPFPYIDGMILQITDHIGRVKVEHNPRTEGGSGYTLAKLVSLGTNALTNFSIQPLRLSILLGVVFSLTGLGFGIYTVWERLSRPGLPLGYAAMIVLICVSAGVQLLVLGMVGEYVGRIFMCLNHKPQFVIKKTFERGVQPKGAPEGRRG